MYDMHIRNYKGTALHNIPHVCSSSYEVVGVLFMENIQHTVLMKNEQLLIGISCPYFHISHKRND